MRYLQRKGICIVIITRIVLNEADLDRRVKAVARKLAPDVVRIRYEIALDSTDKEAIYFRILVSDDASREERLGEVVERVVSELSEQAGRAQELGSYRLVSPLGHGGMGEVWRAEHRMLARDAAIKLVRGGTDASGRELMARFEREAKATAALRSPPTVPLYDFGDR